MLKGHEKYIDKLIEFLDQSPTPYHATSNLSGMLLQEGFKQLDETETWDIEANQHYFVVRNDSSIAAFSTGTADVEKYGMRLVGAHTDSPCLKLRPNPDARKSRYATIGVEVYGSVLLRTWFDRDLAIAGSLYYRDSKGEFQKSLVDSKSPVVTIPSIAIHLHPKANEEQSIDKHMQLNPIFATPSVDEHSDLLAWIKTETSQSVSNSDSILGFDLSLYDTNNACRLGSDLQMFASARIDNLVSCYVAVRALCESHSDYFRLVVCNDHEEVGSASDSGAQGPFLSSVIERAAGRDARIMRRSMLISADGAHGIHPNFPEKHEKNNAPLLNGGVAIKRNSNQRYATSGQTGAWFSNLCESNNISYQTFVSRNDMPCGSTIGPITAAQLGIRTTDVGVPQLAMHSIREVAGVHDVLSFHEAITAFMVSDLAGLY